MNESFANQVEVIKHTSTIAHLSTRLFYLYSVLLNSLERLRANRAERIKYPSIDGNNFKDKQIGMDLKALRVI
jgi:hypothetical protein